jgi:hypothetical protein
VCDAARCDWTITRYNPRTFATTNNQRMLVGFSVNGEQMGSTVTLNGRDLWSMHVMLPNPDSDPAQLDRDRLLLE